MLILVVLLLSWDAAGCAGAGAGSEPGRQVLRDSWRASTFATSPADPRVPERDKPFWGHRRVAVDLGKGNSRPLMVPAVHISQPLDTAAN